MEKEDWRAAYMDVFGMVRRFVFLAGVVAGCAFVGLVALGDEAWDIWRVTLQVSGIMCLTYFVVLIWMVSRIDKMETGD